ncbi:hypothetical protein BVI2075_930021 [Burkholderia vietnamiensis]|nr:hypothetical protein BVI2075_930021 [Burkholderia vietnamiensis]
MATICAIAAYRFMRGLRPGAAGAEERLATATAAFNPAPIANVSRAIPLRCIGSGTGRPAQVSFPLAGRYSVTFSAAERRGC